MPNTLETPETPAPPDTTEVPIAPLLVEEPTIDWSVLILYIIIVSFLGIALVYSLSLDTEYQSFSASIVTAMATIAGFAIGVNISPPK